MTVAFLPVEKAASFSGLVTVTCVLIFPARHREQQTSRTCFLFAGKLLIIMKALTGGNALHQVAQLKTLIIIIIKTETSVIGAIRNAVIFVQ